MNRRSSYCSKCGKPLNTGYSCENIRCEDKITIIKINKNKSVRISYHNQADLKIKIKQGLNRLWIVR